jgi:hypothetical protein
MLFPPFALFACCAAAALASVAANPPFLGAAVLADAGVGALLEPAAGFAGAIWVGRGLIGIVVVVVVVTPRAVPLYPVVAAGVVFVMLDAGAFAGRVVRDIAGFESVLMVFGLAPASPSSAFLFRVGAPDEAAGLAVFATIVGLGFGAFVAEAGDFAAGAVADWPSLPTDASNAAN